MMKIQILIFFILGFSNISNAEDSGGPKVQWQKGHGSGLNYLIYVPQVKSEKPVSLMIGLHGCTQHSQDLADLANWESAADGNNMIVVLPDVPNGGVVLGCWDYYGRGHTESNRHNGPLIAMTEGLLNNKDLKIDKDKIFVTGLSSGSGEAAILGCLRPDLFSGVSLNSGPALGTDKGDLYKPNTTSADMAKLCIQLAGLKINYFSKQKMSIIVSDKDLMVNPLHSDLSFQAMQKVYQLTGSEELNLKNLKGSNTEGHGTLSHDIKNQVRLSFIVNNGLGHAFPSGKGQGRTEKYVNPLSINYPTYLADYFRQ